MCLEMVRARLKRPGDRTVWPQWCSLTWWSRREIYWRGKSYRRPRRGDCQQYWGGRGEGERGGLSCSCDYHLSCLQGCPGSLTLGSWMLTECLVRTDHHLPRYILGPMSSVFSWSPGSWCVILRKHSKLTNNFSPVNISLLETQIFLFQLNSSLIMRTAHRSSAKRWGGAKESQWHEVNLHISSPSVVIRRTTGWPN